MTYIRRIMTYNDVWLSSIANKTIQINLFSSSTQATYMYKRVVGKKIPRTSLKSSLRKCYGQYNENVSKYNVSLGHMMTDVFRSI